MALAAVAKSDLLESLSQWALGAAGDGARVEDVRDLGGHSGETYGFWLVRPDGREGLVVRLSPASRGAAAGDALVRQASLLQVLHVSGVRVPAPRDVSAGHSNFGGGYLMVSMAPGKPLVMGPDAGLPSLSRDDRQLAYEAAALELARIHRPEVYEQLRNWDDVKSPADEIEHWVKVFERAAEPEWASAGAELRAALLRRLPHQWTPGLCHGDFQTNNVLFTLQDGRLRVSAVIDWEMAHLGAVEHDLAWYLMMNDPQAWHPMELRGGVDLDAISECYRIASGQAIQNLAWFQALACYRIAAIAGYQIRLHRTGRKIDAAWERASASMPYFFARARALLEGL